jgi:hypothetical protein
MAFDIQKLRSMSQKSFNAIKSSQSKTEKRGDDRFWKPERDANGNAMAVIRFLPPIDEDSLPWVETYNYFIPHGNSNYVEKSLRTIGKPDPMDEYRRELYQNAKTKEETAEISRKFRQNHNYISNILVIKDPAHPENEGKVKLYRYGVKIFQKIMDKTQVDEAFGDEPVNVFDWFNGANFKMKVTEVGDGSQRFPNYDRSEFSSCSPVGTDDEIVAIANQMYDLKEFVDPNNFKSYDELKEIRDRVFGLGNYAKAQQSFESAPRAQQAKPSYEEEKVNDFGVATAAAMVATTTASTPWDGGDDIDFDSMLNEVEA